MTGPGRTADEPEPVVERPAFDTGTWVVYVDAESGRTIRARSL